MRKVPSPNKPNRPDPTACLLNIWKTACLDSLGTLTGQLQSETECERAEPRRVRACLLAFEIRSHYQLILIEEDEEDSFEQPEGDPFTELLILQEEWQRLQDASNRDQKKGDAG